MDLIINNEARWLMASLVLLVWTLICLNCSWDDRKVFPEVLVCLGIFYLTLVTLANLFRLIGNNI